MKNQGEKYILELTPEQARVVESACELYARLRIGQFERITEMLLNVRDAEDYCFRRDIANGVLKASACAIFGINAWGQPDAKSDELHHRAWDVYQVLRYTRSWHENPKGGWTVNYDKPMSLIGEAVPKCCIEMEADR